MNFVGSIRNNQKLYGIGNPMSQPPALFYLGWEFKSLDFFEIFIKFINHSFLPCKHKNKFLTVYTYNITSFSEVFFVNKFLIIDSHSIIFFSLDKLYTGFFIFTETFDQNPRFFISESLGK